MSLHIVPGGEVVECHGRPIIAQLPAPPAPPRAYDPDEQPETDTTPSLLVCGGCR